MASTYVCLSCALGNCSACSVATRPGSAGSISPCVCRHGRRSVMARPSDPRRAAGAIVAGPDDSLIDTRRAVLAEQVVSSRIQNPSDGRTLLALLVAGRINRTEESSQVLYVLSPGLAAEVAGLIVLEAGSCPPEWQEEFRGALQTYMATDGKVD